MTMHCAVCSATYTPAPTGRRGLTCSTECDRERRRRAAHDRYINMRDAARREAARKHEAQIDRTIEDRITALLERALSTAA